MVKIWAGLVAVGAEVAFLFWVVGSHAFEWMTSGLTLGQ
jgi:hypothetical protein